MYSKYKRSRTIALPWGLISSICLPILCCYFIYNNFNKERYAIEIQSWDPELHKIFPYYPKESHPKRVYTNIFLTGNNKTDSVKLVFGQTLMREQKLYNDKVHGVRFIFNAKSELSVLINILDICYREKPNSFVLDENDFWIFNAEPLLPPKPEMHLCK